jgi:hypothetical protein
LQGTSVDDGLVGHGLRELLQRAWSRVATATESRTSFMHTLHVSCFGATVESFVVMSLSISQSKNCLQESRGNGSDKVFLPKCLR